MRSDTLTHQFIPRLEDFYWNLWSIWILPPRYFFETGRVADLLLLDDVFVPVLSGFIWPTVRKNVIKNKECLVCWLILKRFFICSVTLHEWSMLNWPMPETFTVYYFSFLVCPSRSFNAHLWLKSPKPLILNYFDKKHKCSQAGMYLGFSESFLAEHIVNTTWLYIRGTEPILPACELHILNHISLCNLKL